MTTETTTKTTTLEAAKHVAKIATEAAEVLTVIARGSYRTEDYEEAVNAHARAAEAHADVVIAARLDRGITHSAAHLDIITHNEMASYHRRQVRNLC